MSWNPGERVGPYTIVRELGRGGMGAVYLAHETELGRHVALKVVSQGSIDPDLVLRLQREALALAKVQHPNVLQVYSAQQLEGQFVVVSEFVEGETLEALVERAGPVDPLLAARWLGEVAEAVAACHAQGILHRDLKPANIMHSQAGIKVMDFGLAHDASQERMTLTGVVLGTPGYLAPEALEGERPGPRSDVFGLGATLYVLLCGRPPFAGTTAIEILTQAACGAFTPVRDAAPAVPAWLAAVCERALARRPDDRFESAMAMRDALEGTTVPPRLGGFLAASAVLAAAAVALLVGLLLRAAAADPSGALPAPTPPPPVEAAPVVTEHLPEPELPRAFGFEGWPNPELSKVLEVYEPWAFSRASNGISVLTRDPSRPELAVQFMLPRRASWWIRVRLEDLRLGREGNVRLIMSSGMRTLEDRESNLKNVGWILERLDDSQRLLASLCYGRTLKRIEGRFLEVDPRGPLTLDLHYENETLSLVVSSDHRTLGACSMPLLSAQAPRGGGRLRLGQRLIPSREPSLGRGVEGSEWSGSRCAFTVSALRAWGRGLALDSIPTEPNHDVGRPGWRYLSGEDREAVLKSLEALALDLNTRNSRTRFARYLLAVHFARAGELERAVNQLSQIYVFTKQETGALRANDWADIPLWVRNRVLADLVHYPPEFRVAIGASVMDVLSLDEAVALAENPQQPSDVKRWSEANSRDHRRDWAWVEAATHLGASSPDPRAVDVLQGAGLYAEAWELLNARLASDPDMARDLIGEGQLAFFLGDYEQALARWSQATPEAREKIPQGMLECVERWAKPPR